MPVRFTEAIFAKPGGIDQEAGVIRGVKILGDKSGNGRAYPKGTREAAAQLYEGSRVCFGHNLEAGKRGDRFGDWIGVLRNVREADGLVADLHYLKTDPRAAKLCEAAERFPDRFGMSHSASGDLKHGLSGVIVEKITAVESVDVVTSPATVSGLFESEGWTMKLCEAIEKYFPATYKACGLLEMEGMAELPVEVPASGSSEDAIWSAFRSAIMSAIDDDALDTKGTLKKIGEILKAYQKLTGETGGDKKEPMPESIQAEFASLKTLLTESTSASGKRELARDLCAETGVTATRVLIESLATLADETAMREKLAGEPKANRAAKPLIESIRGGQSDAANLPKTPEEFAARYR